MRYLCLLLLLLIANTSSAQSSQFCFAAAETFYEQVYCQLQAKAQTKNLPPFFQFRKNTETVQYSLLKRVSERNAIKLPAPATAVREAAPESILPLKSPTPSSRPDTKTPNTNTQIGFAIRASQPPLNTSGYDCQFADNAILCGNQVFKLTGNKANHRLTKDALGPENKMALPVYQGGALNAYLTQAYRQYIAKMLEIGLGGVTMTYGKFAYLYQDLHTKGLDFPQRFEIMFGFLKKDKATMSVSESVSLPKDFDSSHCGALGENFYVCDLQGRNYIFVRP
jgi:hypothetical protein